MEQGGSAQECFWRQGRPLFSKGGELWKDMGKEGGKVKKALKKTVSNH